MVRLSLQGNILDVPVDAAITWVIENVINPLELVGGVHWAEHFGMPFRMSREFLRTLNDNVTELEENSTVVDDQIFLQLINRALPSLKKFVLYANRILDWQQAQLPKSAIFEHQQACEVAGPIEPPWIDNPEYKDLEKASSSAFLEYLDCLEDAIPILKSLVEPGFSQSITEQLESTSNKIYQAREILELGYIEAIKKYAFPPSNYSSG